jgi:two-component system NtrC family sensor kinase
MPPSSVSGGGENTDLNTNKNSHMSLKILVICDDPGNGAFIERILVEGRGDEVNWTTYDHQVLTEAERNPPDIIIIEVTLSELDVFQVYQPFRAIPVLQEIPVLFWRVPNTRYMYPKAQALGVAGCMEFMRSYNRDELLKARDVIAEGKSYYLPLG